MDDKVCPRRVVVVGCPGAGKSTFSARLARRIDATLIVRDRLGPLGSAPYRRAVYDATAAGRWVFDGPPYYVESLVYPAVDTVIWLDYRRSLVMARAIRRSLRRTFGPLDEGQAPWSRLSQWVTAGGPRFAWSVYDERRREFGALREHPIIKEVPGGKDFIRFGTPRDAARWLAAQTAPQDGG